MDLSITVSPGDMDIVVAGHTLTMEHAPVAAPGAFYICGRDGDGYIYNLKVPQDLKSVNGQYSRGGVEFAGPGSPDSVGIFGVVYASLDGQSGQGK